MGAQIHVHFLCGAPHRFHQTQHLPGIFPHSSHLLRAPTKYYPRCVPHCSVIRWPSARFVTLPSRNKRYGPQISRRSPRGNGSIRRSDLYHMSRGDGFEGCCWSGGCRRWSKYYTKEASLWAHFPFPLPPFLARKTTKLPNLVSL